MKFCNWLTLTTAGLGASQRAYTEGPNVLDWHPVTITTANWTTRDLTTAERRALVNNFNGFRLPMENVGLNQGNVSKPENAYNEWYRAAAYNPPSPSGTDPGGATISANHVFFGFGRNTITGADANFFMSGDPFSDRTTPVGYFNGANTLADGTTTRDTTNRYGIYDLSGNVSEWGQDYCGSTSRHSTLGGNYQGVSPFSTLAASHRLSVLTITTSDEIGFRVVQVR